MQSVHFSEVIKHKHHLPKKSSLRPMKHADSKTFSLKAVCIGLTYVIFKPIFTLKLKNKYDKKSIMLKIEINMLPVGQEALCERFGLDWLNHEGFRADNLTETAS